MTPQDVKAAVGRLHRVLQHNEREPVGSQWRREPKAAAHHGTPRAQDPTRWNRAFAADLRTLLASHSALTAEVERCREAYGASPSSPSSGDPEGWRPIESAPRDGTPILGWSDEGVCYVCWKGKYSTWTFFDGGPTRGSYGFEPTAWRPLPNLPGVGVSALGHGKPLSGATSDPLPDLPESLGDAT